MILAVPPRPASFARRLLLLASLAATRALSADPAPPAAAKPFVLYMGTDFAIEHHKAYLPVLDVQGRAFVVKNKGRELLVPMVGGQVNLKIEQALKLASHSATLAGLKTDRCYTPGNDPYLKFNNSAGGGASLASLDNANANQNAAAHGYAVISNNPYAPASEVAASLSRLNAANAAQSSAMDTAQFGTMDNMGEKAMDLQEAIAQKLFDAIEVSFEVSSPEFLEKPYVVLIVRYHEKDAAPGSGSNWIYAKALNSIGASPTKIYLRQGGLPPGYEIEECQVRLYNQGREIATNIAPKRVELSRDEAFQYLKIAYLRRHKDSTLPPTPALGRPDRLTMAQLAPARRTQTFYVQVDQEGRPGLAFTDEACTAPVEADDAALIANVRFYPALEAGKATAGIARLHFEDLTL